NRDRLHKANDFIASVLLGNSSVELVACRCERKCSSRCDIHSISYIRSPSICDLEEVTAEQIYRGITISIKTATLVNNGNTIQHAYTYRVTRLDAGWHRKRNALANLKNFIKRHWAAPYLAVTVERIWS